MDLETSSAIALSFETLGKSVLKHFRPLGARSCPSFIIKSKNLPSEMICTPSLGINVGIVSILLIFGVLFSLPLKLLLNTNYGSSTDESGKGAGTRTRTEISIDYRGLKLCSNFDYPSAVKASFFSNYDGNCTHVKPREKKLGKIEAPQRKTKFRLMAENAGIIAEEGDENVSGNHKKSLSIAGHILGVMLIGSALAALIEVLRARLCMVNKEQRPEGNGLGRKSSLRDSQRRHVRKDTIQAQKSFEIQGMMHRSPLRLIAARPPPLLRRSSFPAQCFNRTDIPVSTTSTAIHGRLSRRPSFVVDSDEDPNTLTDFRRHSRLIRRH